MWEMLLDSGRFKKSKQQKKDLPQDEHFLCNKIGTTNKVLTKQTVKLH